MEHKNSQGLLVSRKSEALLNKVYPVLKNFPKSEKFSLCAEIKQNFIKDYEHHVEERLNIDNGATLCGSCHMEFHTIYGRKITNEEMFLEFLEKEEVAHNG